MDSAITRQNINKEVFYIRPGKIRFQVWADRYTNLKVILNVYRSDGICEHFIVDTDYYDVQASSHKRVTRDFMKFSIPREYTGGR